MRTFKKQPDNKRSVYLKFVGELEGQLRQAYAKRHEQGRETQASLAKKIGVDRSVINRRLTGRTNMTALTIAEMVWALGFCITISIFDPEDVSTNHHRIVPIHDDADGPETVRALDFKSAPTSTDATLQYKISMV